MNSAASPSASTTIPNAASPTQDNIPPFHPHPLLRGGHAQTLAAVYFPGKLPAYRAMRHEMPLDDGDRIVLHDDRPPQWRDGDRVALLIHGLAGCYGSAYMQRVAQRLNERGFRSLRFDLRGCGAGERLARYPYHGGRSDDAATALRWLAHTSPHSPVTLIGFSLGGNIALKLLGQCGDAPPGHLDSAIAVCPPIELDACVAALSKPLNRLYDRYFARVLWRRITDPRRACPGAVTVEMPRRPRTLWEFDNTFTAPVCGFGTADRYYQSCSSAQFLPGIRLPTWILAAADDPLIPADIFTRATLSPTTSLHLAAGGGHVGFIARSNGDPDRRWMDWRIVEWVASLPRR
jgi:predicted alpha/beta-fold hydrolase